jgi:hypothetical protein
VRWRAPPRVNDANPAAAPWPSFNSVCRSSRAARSAGTRPNSSAETSDTASVKSSTPPLIRIS